MPNPAASRSSFVFDSLFAMVVILAGERIDPSRKHL
jgi:hypothetical protein